MEELIHNQDNESEIQIKIKAYPFKFLPSPHNMGLAYLSDPRC
jgi:hypothetical protein